MSNLVEHAKIELELAGLLSEESDFYGGMTGKSVLELMEVFSKQGHSGMSAPLVADLFKKLVNYEPLQPITGKNEEWNDVSEMMGEKNTEYFQNKRESGLFKKNGIITYINAIIKRTPDGTTWSGPL